MAELRSWIRRARRWIRDHVPPGLRTLVGLLLIAGGMLGFLPVFAFWWIPLGVFVIALDIRPLDRALRRYLEQRQDAGAAEDDAAEDDAADGGVAEDGDAASAAPGRGADGEGAAERRRGDGM
jgi:hypothetical protein